MTIFDDISSLEDIQKRKLRLEKKLRVNEKSISDKTDIINLLFNNKEGFGSFFGEKDSKMAIMENLLPLGVNYILKQIQNNPDKKLLKKLIIYSVFGSLSALLVYQYLKYRKTRTMK